jgi:hypothetical protein
VKNIKGVNVPREAGRGMLTVVNICQQKQPPERGCTIRGERREYLTEGRRGVQSEHSTRKREAFTEGEPS